MNVENRKILVLGGGGMVGLAVCRELLERRPREIQIHSLTMAESEDACRELAPLAGTTVLTPSAGDIFGLRHGGTRREKIRSQLNPLGEGDLGGFVLYDLLVGSKPDFVIDAVNTATGIAYRDIFSSAERVVAQIDGDGLGDEEVEALLEALYIPRLIRHIQIMYNGLLDAGVQVYVKVGTTGTGGMGLNVPYTHSEEKPSRTLLSKTAMAGAHSMLLFLMARTPGGPIVKEIKPAAAIAWKRIGYGPIHRKREPIRLVDARPRPVGSTFSSDDPGAARVREETLDNVFIDTGENGVFSLEEFALITSGEQMEFVTPEEIAKYAVFEIQGGNTGYDIVSALDSAVLGPTYRAGLLRHWAIEKMTALEREHGVRSVAFELLGPPKNSKLLFEAHLFRAAFQTMGAVRDSTPEEVCERLNRLVLEQPEEANRIVSVGMPILLESGELLRGPRVIVPPEARNEEVTPEKLERWVRDGWVDLRLANCAKWVERFRRIHQEVQSLPEGDTSSRHLRDRHFWNEAQGIQPGKTVAWILSSEEGGWRWKR
ncbi:MAG TPA: short-chain dehydrogenase [Thermoanaerobaculia bacterium]|nr:short-chain dehydrogenase [Thermoanaerobaculia bacterium]